MDVLNTLKDIIPWVLFFHGLYRLCQVMSPSLWPSTYPYRLTASECDYWDASVVSSVHGFMVSVVGFYVLFTEEELYTRGYSYQSPLSLLCVHIIVGYLISDLYLGLTHLDWPGTNMMLFHHILGIFSMIYTTAHHFGSGLIVCLVVLEATSPFINFRWFFDKSGMKITSPTLYLINGAMITISWFALRICFYGWAIFNYIFHLWAELMSYDNNMHTFVVLFGIGGGYVLQVLWFKKIFAGMMKALRGNKKSV